MKIDIKELLSKIKLPSLSFFKSKDIVGVDMGSTSVKLVQLQNGRLVRWAYKELEIKEDNPEAPLADRLAATRQLLSDFFSQEKNSPKTAAISVTGNSVIVRYVKFPK